MKDPLEFTEIQKLAERALDAGQSLELGILLTLAGSMANGDTAVLRRLAEACWKYVLKEQADPRYYADRN